MTPDQLFNLFLLLAVALLPSVLTALLPHPTEAQARVFRVILAVLGRLSVLRHGVAPGTLHVPFTRQPRPLRAVLREVAAPLRWSLEYDVSRDRRPASTEQPDTEPRCIECGGTPACAGGPIMHDPSCADPRVTVSRAHVLHHGTPLALLLAIGLALTPACGTISSAKRVTAQALKSDKALAGELKRFSGDEEEKILSGSKTQEEVRARLDSFRKAVDFSFKILERAGQNLKDVAKALGVEPEKPAAGPPKPLAPVAAGGAR